MRRFIVPLLLVFGLAGAARQPVRGREATPVAGDSALAAMGYQELLIQVGNDKFVAPGQVRAGRTLIVLENIGAESRHSTLLRLPDDLTIGGLFEGGSDDAPPPWYLQSSFPGFPGEVLPGQTRVALVDLTPGLYLLVDSFTAFFAVFPSDDGEAAPAPDPAADGVVQLFEYGFTFPDQLSTGHHLWQVVNAGRVPHELMLVKAPDGTTIEQATALLTGGPSDDASPIAGGLSEDDLIPAGGLGWLTQGGVAWTEVDLQPGTYVAVCWVFEPESAMPHAMLGMIQIVTVA